MQEIYTKPIKEQLMPIDYIVMQPGGNNTALVMGIPSEQKERRRINDVLMAEDPTIEQVGYIMPGRLEMAGGEFCGNALRSTALNELKGKQGEIQIQVSGVAQKLSAGVKQNGDAWAQMPINQSFNTVKRLDASTYQVDLQGITQIVAFSRQYDGLSQDEYKEIGFAMLRGYGLTESKAASGVMFVTGDESSLKINPVVWVRDIETLFFETACGSGTTAVGQVLAKLQNRDISQQIIQPSGMPIDILVRVQNGTFTSAEISGPVKKLRQGVVYGNM